MTELLLALCGIALASAAVWQLFATFRSGTYGARGGRTIRRARHPTMFWANVVGLAMTLVLGLSLAAWQWF